MTRIEEFRKALSEHSKNGVSLTDLMKKVNATTSAAYSAISTLRTHEGWRIDQKNGKYYIKGQETDRMSGKKTTRSYVRRAPAASNSNELPFPLPKNSNRLPADKKEQFDSMIKQASFYYRCAQELIRAEQLIII